MKVSHKQDIDMKSKIGIDLWGKWGCLLLEAAAPMNS